MREVVFSLDVSGPNLDVRLEDAGGLLSQTAAGPLASISQLALLDLSQLEPSDALEAGARLACIYRGDVGSTLREVLLTDNKVRISISVQDETLWQLPWELLVHPADFGRFLVLEPNVSLVRHLLRPQTACPNDDDAVSGRVVSVCVQRKGRAILDLAAEANRIRDFAAINALEFAPVLKPTWRSFASSLSSGAVVVHFAGHGAKRDGTCVLEFEPSGAASEADVEVSRFLSTSDRADARIIYLNACESTAGLCRLSRHALQSVRVVIGYRNRVPDETALRVTRELARSLVRADNLDEGVRIFRQSVSYGSLQWANVLIWGSTFGPLTDLYPALSAAKGHFEDEASLDRDLEMDLRNLVLPVGLFVALFLASVGLLFYFRSSVALLGEFLVLLGPCAALALVLGTVRVRSFLNHRIAIYYGIVRAFVEASTRTGDDVNVRTDLSALVRLGRACSRLTHHFVWVRNRTLQRLQHLRQRMTNPGVRDVARFRTE